jgi:predicted Ser/Thr protein kinase
MSEPKRCSLCGAEMPPEAPEGLCPNCLFKVGLESQSQAPVETASATKSAGFTPPTPQELNVHFPQLEFLELLGKGGMGAVYKARQKSLDRLVAVKILPPDVGLDAGFADRFTREARALAKLNHPHIVGVHDFGHVGDFYYFIMEFVDGVNVRQAIRAGQLKPPEALQIVPQICDALQFAHEEGVVHRDIKPENILLDKRGRVKIADFGLAKLLNKTTEDLTLTGTKQIVGTVPYMAPEQIEGARDVDHRADIYSLGVTFYEMLTGALPLGRFPVPSKMVRIDVRLDDVVLRTLEKAPELRYQQAGDVKAEVETISRTPAGKPFTGVMKDVAGHVLHGSKKAASWMAGKATGAGVEMKQAAEAFAKNQLAKDGEGAWKKTLWLWGFIALAILGIVLDFTRRRFAPLGTIGGLAPLALLAWKERGTEVGRHAKLWFLGLIFTYVLMHIILSGLEGIFIAAMATVVVYVIWDLLRSWWRRPPKEPLPDTPPPAAEQ